MDDIYRDLLRRFSLKIDKAITHEELAFWEKVYFSVWCQWADYLDKDLKIKII